MIWEFSRRSTVRSVSASSPFRLFLPPKLRDMSAQTKILKITSPLFLVFVDKDKDFRAQFKKHVGYLVRSSLSFSFSFSSSDQHFLSGIYLTIGVFLPVSTGCLLRQRRRSDLEPRPDSLESARTNRYVRSYRRGKYFHSTTKYPSLFIHLYATNSKWNLRSARREVADSRSPFPLFLLHQYNKAGAITGLTTYQNLISQRGKMEGFIILGEFLLLDACSASTSTSSRSLSLSLSL